MTLRTRVKICGITRPQDAVLAARLGADALGLMFYAGSKRAITLRQAAEIRAAVPAFVSVVGLFVNPQRIDVESTLQAVHLDCLQFHGDEDPAFCESFAIPYIKVVRVPAEADDSGHGKLLQQVEEQAAQFSGASAILLDTYDPQQRGGTGKQFDWTLARRCVEQLAAPIVLAGGLSADNAARAINEVRPWALDLSSGVESEPGIKDPDKLQAFFEEVNRVRI